MSSINPFNITSWPGYQAWEKASSRMMDSMVKDTFFLDLSGRMISTMLQSKVMVDRLLGMDPSGRNALPSVSDVVQMQQRVQDLERRVADMERLKASNGADA